MRTSRAPWPTDATAARRSGADRAPAAREPFRSTGTIASAGESGSRVTIGLVRMNRRVEASAAAEQRTGCVAASPAAAAIRSVRPTRAVAARPSLGAVRSAASGEVSTGSTRTPTGTARPGAG